MTSDNKSTAPFQGYGSKFILAALEDDDTSQDAICDPRKELRDYLESPREPDVSDPIKWWGVSKSFPLLAFLFSNGKF